MSTTVAHPRTSRFPGKGIGMAVIGLALAAAIGYGISTVGDETVQETTTGAAVVNSADVAHVNRAGEFAADRQRLLNQATTGVAPVAETITTPSVEELAGILAREATSFLSAEEWERSLRSRMQTDALQKFYLGDQQPTGPKTQGPQ